VAARASRAGGRVETPGLTVTDTRSLDWQAADWFLPSAIRNPLSLDEDGDAIISMGWLSGATSLLRPAAAGRRSRSYHQGRELYFCLGGELPFAEYDRDGTERRVVLREGYWIDRGPGGVHGGGDGPPPVAVNSIGWMMADEDAFVGVRESRDLVEVLAGEVPPPPSAEPAPAATVEAAAVKLDRPGIDGVRIVSSRELSWEPHPFLPGARIKPLSRRRDGDATVSLLWLPRGRHPAAGVLPFRARSDFREFALVLEGELRVWHYADASGARGESVLLERGFWLDRRAGCVHGFEDALASRTGATLLHFATRRDARFVKDREKHERWTFTLTEGIGGVIAHQDEAHRAALVESLQKRCSAIEPQSHNAPTPPRTP
jgi:hypothetical protein